MTDEIRPMELAEAATIASDDYMLLDGDTYGTRKVLASSFVAALANLEAPKRDASTGRYDNDELHDWLVKQRDGLLYTTRVPLYSYSTSPDGTKMDANAGLSCTPSTADTANADDYANRGPFRRWDVNGGGNDDGSPFTTAMRLYDTDFALDGANGNVLEMAMTLYYRVTVSAHYMYITITDTPYNGYDVQPGGRLPDGTVRPYMLYAKYGGALHDGDYASVSGLPILNRSISHTSLVSTYAQPLGDAYSGKSIADDWYVKTMMLVKYATKNSQSVFAGCTSYNYYYPVTVAESNATSVIISSAQAANLVVGSRLMMGTSTTSGTDRGNSTQYSVFDGLRISSIEAYDSSNSRVNLDTDAAFSTTVGVYVCTAPWGTGELDGVLGADGTISSGGRTNGKEPFLLQGIECMYGCYEVLGDVLLYAGSEAVDVYVCYDSVHEQTSYNASYYAKVTSMSTSDSSGWLYFADFEDAGGLLVGTGTATGTSVGMCDGHYHSASTSTGWREFLGLGNLGNGANAGLWFVISVNGVASASWIIASRLSVTGRTVAAA